MMTFFTPTKTPRSVKDSMDHAYPNQDGVEVSKIKKPFRLKAGKAFETLKLFLNYLPITETPEATGVVAIGAADGGCRGAKMRAARACQPLPRFTMTPKK